MTTLERERAPRVVVGVDGSSQSKQALRWAARIAGPAGAHLEAVAAWSFPAIYGRPAPASNWDPERDARKSLTETVDEVFAEHRPKDLKIIVQQGDAAQVLLEQSAGAMMVIVGSRGHGGFAGLLLGSVSAKVAEHAPCPVLVVHGETLALEPVS